MQRWVRDGVSGLRGGRPGCVCCGEVLHDHWSQQWHRQRDRHGHRKERYAHEDRAHTVSMGGVYKMGGYWGTLNLKYLTYSEVCVLNIKNVLLCHIPFILKRTHSLLKGVSYKQHAQFL